MDKFPQAFRRYEAVVNTDDIETFYQLEMSFGSWAGHNWKGSGRQIRALENEWNSQLGGWYRHWGGRKQYTRPYFHRITGYMKQHPHATLREARGHRRR
jgi:hypothetical protein